VTSSVGADRPAAAPNRPARPVLEQVQRVPAPMARPGTVNDVRQAPEGPEIGAFFDFDGTVIAGYSAAVFARDRFRKRQVSLGEVLRTLAFYVDASAGRVDLADMLNLTARSWQGRTHEELSELGQRLYDEQIADRVFPEMRELVREHLRRGHTVALTSSATSYQLEPVAHALGVPHVVCTRLEVEGGVLTGNVVGRAPWGPGKADAVQLLARRQKVDLSRSYAYADGNEDVPLLHLVGNPRAVNPGDRLAAVARRRGWPVLRLQSRGSSTSLKMKARNIAGTAAILPAAAAGIVVGVANGSKRSGVDVGYPLWVDLLLGINGVQVEAVGVENAWSDRPCVFLHNHLTNFDSFLVSKVVRSGVSGVGKKEIGKNPVGALLGWALDAAMIDRSDTAKAIEQMQPLVEKLRDGISLAIAPEGTRSRTGELGAFKKGAFHVAMQAGVPVVPVVLRNADVLGSASATMMRPGTVQLAVLPAVPTAGWTTEDLGARVAEVRQQFVDTLAGWPGDSQT
jgi:putative phosphoserine phosphatase/1-acylglycerol-3-phosphate O-acyltransferase